MKTSKKRLPIQLQTETIRALSMQQLPDVVGGVVASLRRATFTQDFDVCPSTRTTGSC